MDAAARKAERQLKKLAKLEEQLVKEKQRTQKYKTRIQESKAKKASRRSPGAPQNKRAQTVWVRALQEWNQGKESYRIPKKGTPEYDEVFAIKQKLMTEDTTGGESDKSESSPKRLKTHAEIKAEMDDYVPPLPNEGDPTNQDLGLGLEGEM